MSIGPPTSSLGGREELADPLVPPSDSPPFLQLIDESTPSTQHLVCLSVPGLSEQSYIFIVTASTFGCFPPVIRRASPRRPHFQRHSFFKTPLHLSSQSFHIFFYLTYILSSLRLLPPLCLEILASIQRAHRELTASSCLCPQLGLVPQLHHVCQRYSDPRP